MKRDRMALHGFGKMFQKFWLDQVEHTNKILDFILLRGGIVETPGLKVFSSLGIILFLAY